MLPRRWLNADVARWKRSADDDIPLGSFAPLVVMDLERRLAAAVLQHKLRQKWRTLGRTARGPAPPASTCWAVGQDQVKLTIDPAPDADMVGPFGTPPRADGVRRLFQASLNAGRAGDAVAALRLPGRAPCGAARGLPGLGVPGPPRRTPADLPAHELPQYVHELRETAYASDTVGTALGARPGTAVEDPDCLPDPVGYAHNPVGWRRPLSNFRGGAGEGRPLEIG